MRFNIPCLALGLISTAYAVPVAINVGLSYSSITARNGNFPHVEYEFTREGQPRKIKLEKNLPKFKFPSHQPSLANAAVETVLAGFGTTGSALNDFVGVDMEENQDPRTIDFNVTSVILLEPGGIYCPCVGTATILFKSQTIIGTLISYERRFPAVEGDEAQKERKERIKKERIQKTKTICLEFVPAGASKNPENGIGRLNHRCPELD
ncbi:hypothetical protein F5879DRAFT_921693 [Lentinula edodes]|uniref:uncharacterized protein n=1 Tax=Lentinula edodes TaxID=5353 RepID=UPI001BFBDE04|nr:uncharacterized protein C8R40DRAFT_1119668 [Lentinula edodes]KAF8829418.1 hypothetical protein HHX47_DHR3000867 [Lentinula edodes]KAH7872049.1 hypothetical protein C8R40DRAFT_1119668 [Lentinula edodes]KAJ3905172.1 hypothetical protein F5879DRAFT_921693 [Lentinula edodes]